LERGALDKLDKRVIIKLSGEALAGDARNPGEYYDDGVIGKITDEILTLRNRGVGIGLVVGGGNIWRGRSAKPSMDKVAADQIGMMATVMNAVYLADAFQKRGVAAVIMTPVIIGTLTEQFEKKKALAYMKKGTVLIFAAGTGHPFFSTDTIAAIRGAELEADILLFAKNIDGVYTDDPKVNKSAKKLDSITYNEIIRNKLGVIDIAASCICEQQRLPGVIFKLNEPNGIVTAAAGTTEEILKIGTIVSI